METGQGALIISHGGACLAVQGQTLVDEPASEYRGLYQRFAQLIAEGASDVDIRPLRHVADAFLRGQRVIVPPFLDT